MTLKEIAGQLENLTIGNFFNREKMPKGWIFNQLHTHFVRAETTTPYVTEIAMLDGFWWYVEVTKVPNVPNCYDYYLPDTREQNQAVLDRLFARPY